MTYEEYIRKLEELKLQAEQAIISQMPLLEADAQQALIDYIDENFNTQAGKLVADERAVQGLNNFSDVYLSVLTELESYQGAVSKYLKNFKSIAQVMEEYQVSQGRDIAQAKLGSVQEIVINEIINAYSDNGLNQGFVQPLRELLFENVTGGMNKRQAKAHLEDYIASGKDTTGKLNRYLVQTAQQGVDSYAGATNVKIMQTFKIDTMIMSGSLIKTSSNQCRYAIEKLGGIIDRSDWPKLKAMAEQDGLIEGTTFDNLPINKLHHGCRHEFTPTILTSTQREKLLSSPVNS